MSFNPSALTQPVLLTPALNGSAKGNASLERPKTAPAQQKSKTTNGLDRKIALAARQSASAGAASRKQWQKPKDLTDAMVDEDDAPVNQAKSGADNITVVVRVRPESAREKSERDSSKNPSRTVVRVVDTSMIVFDPTDEVDGSISPHKRRTLGMRRGKDLKFVFDRVFDESAQQMEVYEGTAKTLLQGVLDGFNATVFAYGATGAGKTHTMLGNAGNPGVICMCMCDLFLMMDQRTDKNYSVKVSMLEIYNETVRDLLADPSAPQPKNSQRSIDIREDKDKGVVVTNLSQHSPKNADEVLALLMRGNRNRTQHGTEANPDSSRSHAVFQVLIEQKDRTADVLTHYKLSKLSLIDLAGSERAAVTKNTGARLVEGANINKSLLALSNCINALSKSGGQTKYVPYRDSKLTRLLKDSLGGNCRTMMIAAISPSSLTYDDTHNTLLYADRAKQIKVNVKKNILSVDMHVSRYRQIIEEQKTEIEELKKKLDLASSFRDTTKSQEAMDLERDKAEMQRYFADLKVAHKEGLDLKHRLIDIEESTRQNALDICRMEQEVASWRLTHPGEEDPVRISQLKREIESLLQRSKTFAAKKIDVEKSLAQNQQRDKAIMEKAYVQVKTPENRAWLEQENRIHDAQLENLDLMRIISLLGARNQRHKIERELYLSALSNGRSTVAEQARRLREHGDMPEQIEKKSSISMNMLYYAEQRSSDSLKASSGESPSQRIPAPAADAMPFQFEAGSSVDADQSLVFSRPMDDSSMFRSPTRPSEALVHETAFRTPNGLSTARRRPVFRTILQSEPEQIETADQQDTMIDDISQSVAHFDDSDCEDEVMTDVCDSPDLLSSHSSTGRQASLVQPSAQPTLQFGFQPTQYQSVFTSSAGSGRLDIGQASATAPRPTSTQQQQQVKRGTATAPSRFVQRRIVSQGTPVVKTDLRQLVSKQKGASSGRFSPVESKYQAARAIKKSRKSIVTDKSAVLYKDIEQTYTQFARSRSGTEAEKSEKLARQQELFKGATSIKDRARDENWGAGIPAFKVSIGSLSMSFDQGIESFANRSLNGQQTHTDGGPQPKRPKLAQQSTTPAEVPQYMQSTASSASRTKKRKDASSLQWSNGLRSSSSGPAPTPMQIVTQQVMQQRPPATSHGYPIQGSDLNKENSLFTQQAQKGFAGRPLTAPAKAARFDFAAARQPFALLNPPKG